MERRNAIRGIGVTIGSAVMSPTLVGLLQSCQSEKVGDWKPGFLTSEQGWFVERLTDIILPSNSQLPGARELNLHIFIDKYYESTLKQGEKIELKEDLNLSTKDLFNFADEKNPANVTDDHVKNWLSNRLSGTPADHLDDVKPLRNQQTDSEKIYRFIDSLRRLLIWSYTNTELVGEKLMAYNPKPGKQIGCMDLQQATKGKAWSLKY
jgi:hypothetical protein